MDLYFSEEQNLLRDTVARLCEDLNDSTVIRALERDSRGYSNAFWGALSEMGVTGLLVEEDRGGIGLGLLECVITHEEMGRTLAPSPHFVSSVLAARLLALAGSDAQHALWLPGISSGERIVVPAWQEAGVSADLSQLKMQAQLDGNAWVLQGEKVLVPFANSAEAFIVLARCQGRIQGFLVPADLAELRVQPNHAEQNLHAVTFDQVRVPLDAGLPANKMRSEGQPPELRSLCSRDAQDGWLFRNITCHTTFSVKPHREPTEIFRKIA